MVICYTVTESEYTIAVANFGIAVEEVANLFQIILNLELLYVKGAEVGEQKRW